MTTGDRKISSDQSEPEDASSLESAIGEERAERLRELYAKAIKAQVKMVRSCAKGEGVDRHLYGLKCQAREHGMQELPALFDCPAYKKLTNTILSTSNCGNPSLQLFGFGPVSPAGYGIGYIIKDNGISFAFHPNTVKQLGSY